MIQKILFDFVRAYLLAYVAFRLASDFEKNLAILCCIYADCFGSRRRKKRKLLLLVILILS
jgi:hypothetical protein